MFKKYYPAIDYMIVAMAAVGKGKHELAAKAMEKARRSPDFEAAIAVLDKANERRPTTASVAKKAPSLAEAMRTLAARAKVKPKAKKKMAKKTKADAETLNDGELTEDDLLGDDVEAADEGEDEGLDLDGLELDEDEDEGDGEEADADEMDLDLETLDGADDDVVEMPEATASEVLTDNSTGSQDPVAPGSEGAPETTDKGEPPTDVTTTMIKAEARIKAQKQRQDAQTATTRAAEARRMLANLAFLEQQSTEIAAKRPTATKAK